MLLNSSHLKGSQTASEDTHAKPAFNNLLGDTLTNTPPCRTIPTSPSWKTTLPALTTCFGPHLCNKQFHHGQTSAQRTGSYFSVPYGFFFIRLGLDKCLSSCMQGIKALGKHFTSCCTTKYWHLVGHYVGKICILPQNKLVATKPMPHLTTVFLPY